MRNVIHPRPNPIVAAMYTLRDMDVDVIVEHGPSGCCFMASRPLEDANVRVVTSGMRDNDLVFGGEEPLINTLRQVEEKFHPRTVAVVGTCASMIIGEDMAKSIKRAGIDANVFPVDCHGCMGDNTRGAIRALEAARDAGVIDKEECDRQISLMKAATRLEKNVGMASKDYIQPAVSPTKMHVCRRIVDVLSGGGRVAVVMDAKKEGARQGTPEDQELLRRDHRRPGIQGRDHRQADRRARRVRHSRRQDEGGRGRFRTGPNDHSGDMPRLPTDQPRQLANYLNQGCRWAVGEISSHTMVMGAHSIVPLETADTLREMLE